MPGAFPIEECGIAKLNRAGERLAEAGDHQELLSLVRRAIACARTGHCREAACCFISCAASLARAETRA